MRIEIENLGKRFKSEWIFRNFSSTFEEKKVYAVIGPNGSGKSTLLQVLWGQLLPSKGRVAYFHEGNQIPEEDIFQFISIATPYMELVEEFTLTEMVNFHFCFKSLRTGVNRQELLELIELTHARDKQIGYFSSGMKQRLKLALAFYSDTDLLFLDEPTTNLDRKSVEWYQKHLETAIRERTVFIASNQPHEYPKDAIEINMNTFK